MSEIIIKQAKHVGAVIELYKGEYSITLTVEQLEELLKMNR